MKKKYLILKGMCGMGNRILAVLTALLYCEISGRKLVIDWADGMYSRKGENAFDELFYCPGAVKEALNAKTVYPTIWRGRLEKNVIEAFGGSEKEFYSSLSEKFREKFSINFSKNYYKEDILVAFEFFFRYDLLRDGLTRAGINFDNSFKCLSSFAKKNLFLKGTLRKKIDDFARDNFNGKVIGVHVRATDNMEKYNAHLGKQVFVFQHYSIIEEIIKNHPDARIFLATDSEKILKEFKEKYRNIISLDKYYSSAGEAIHMDKKCLDKNKMAEECLMDIFLLARCDFLIYSCSSTFGEVARIFSRAEEKNIFVVEQKVNFDRKFPEKLPGSFWGITVLFNPVGYRNKLENFKRFRNSSKKQGLKLVVVELVFGDNNFELNKEDAEILVQIRTSKDNILWQKERLLNVALDHLPEDCDKVAWLDCDIIFKNDDWINEATKALQDYKVVQLFSRAFFESKDYKVTNEGPTKDSSSMVFAMSHPDSRRNLESWFKKGHPGFAWAARKEVFGGIGFYDRLIVGSADFLLLRSFFGDMGYSKKNFPPIMARFQNMWATKMFSRVMGSVYFVSGDILHLWHGKFKNRFYVLRGIPLIKYHFDPEKDVKVDSSGVLVWSTNKNKLIKSVRSYFWRRNEASNFFIGFFATIYYFFMQPGRQTAKIYHNLGGKAGAVLRGASPIAYSILRKVVDRVESFTEKVSKKG